MWAPGTLVVCVDDGPAKGGGMAPTKLVRGNVYTVSECARTILGMLGVYLADHTPPAGFIGPFAASRFRPVSPVHKQIIRDLLVPVPDPDLIVEEGIDAVLRERLGAG